MFMDDGTPMPLTRWGVFEEQFDFEMPDLAAWVRTKVASLRLLGYRALAIAKSFYGLLQAMETMSLQVEGSTVVVTHVSGTIIKLREDGNVDFAPARNMVLDPKQFLLYKPIAADSWTPEEVEARFGKQ